MKTIQLITVLKHVSPDDPVYTLQLNALNAHLAMPGMKMIHIVSTTEEKAEAVDDLLDIVGRTRITHHANVPGLTNKNGLEYLNRVIRYVRVESELPHAYSDFIGYVNADIILPPTLPYILASIQTTATQYLITGQRLNVQIPPNVFVNTKTPGWWKGLLSWPSAMHPPSGMDYFILPERRTQSFPYIIPDVTLGRWYVDNVILYTMMKHNIPVIDATGYITAVHQEHDYSHFPGGLEALAASEESLANKAHLPQDTPPPTLLDVNFRILKQAN